MSGKVIHYIGTADVYYIDAADWRVNQGVSADKGVPERMVWHAGNNWTWPVRDPNTDQLLDEIIVEYMERAPEFVVVDTDSQVHVPFLSAKKRTLQYSALQLGRAAADQVDPVTAAKRLSTETPITHTGPADVPGVTDTREEAPPTGRIPENEADASDATARAVIKETSSRRK